MNSLRKRHYKRGTSAATASLCLVRPAGLHTLKNFVIASEERARQSRRYALCVQQVDILKSFVIASEERARQSRRYACPLYKQQDCLVR